MATDAVVNPGKTAFLEDYLPKNRDTNLEEANKAWAAAGNPGTLSESLFSKVRAKLGLTTKGAAGAAPDKKHSVPAKKAESKETAKKVVVKKVKKTAATPAKVAPAVEAKPESTPAAAKPTAKVKAAERESALVRVEEHLDELVLALKQIDGMDEAAETLRKVRRHVVRGHQG